MTLKEPREKEKDDLNLHRVESMNTGLWNKSEGKKVVALRRLQASQRMTGNESRFVNKTKFG